MYSKNDLYITYHDKQQIKNLDQNTVLIDVNNFNSRHPYSKNDTFFLNQKWLCGPRDKSVNYIYDTEQVYHPDHFSRFAYNNNCEYGYCTGVWPGRYDVNGWCCEDIQPANVAPERFYDNPSRQCRVMSQARVDYDLMKNGVCLTNKQ